ncbi:MAG: hypothetical protein A4E73_01902 [Syntrophaceae bacterium PtaU1.Bin231]|nr:MAG: hypothetical protein A4E73_01902 [Syntrophaceae bacterium PtaU1.Bin231]
MLDLVDGAQDEYRLVEGDVELHPRRKRLADLLDLGLDPADDLHRVGAGLLLEPHADGGNAVVAGDRTHVLHAVLGAAEVPDADRRTLTVRNDQVVEILYAGEFALDLDRVFLRAAFDPPARKLDVFPLQGLLDVARSDLVGAHLVRVDPDPDLAQPQTAQIDRPDAVDPLELFLQDLVGVGRQFADRFLAGEVQPEHGRGVGIDLLDDRLFRVFGEPLADKRDLLPHVLDRLVDVPLQDKFHRDVGNAHPAGRGDALDPVDGVDGRLDLVGDVDVHDLGAGTLEFRADVDQREIDLGEEIHADVRIADDAEHDQRQHQHRGKDGAFDGGVSEPH